MSVGPCTKELIYFLRKRGRICKIAQTHSGRFFLMENFPSVKQLILLSKSVLDQTGREITMQSLILLCS